VIRLNGTWLTISIALIGTAIGIAYIAGGRVERLDNGPVKQASLESAMAEQKKDTDRRFEKLEQKVEDASDKTANKLFSMQADISTIKGKLEAIFPAPTNKRADAGSERSVR